MFSTAGRRVVSKQAARLLCPIITWTARPPALGSHPSERSGRQIAVAAPFPAPCLQPKLPGSCGSLGLQHACPRPASVPAAAARSASTSTNRRSGAAGAGPGAEGAEAGPAAAAVHWRKSYHLEAQGARNRCASRTDDGHDVVSDIPKSMGGGDTAAQPVYLLLAALAGCETATANFVARQMQIRLRGISFSLDAWRDPRGALHLPISAEPEEAEAPSMLQEVRGTALVDTDASQEQIDALAHQVHWRCPVASMMVASGCKLDIQWRKAAAP